MSQTSRKTKSPRNKKAAIQRAAFAVKAGVRVEDAAANEGVCKSSVYSYFRDTRNGLPDSIPHTREVSEETLKKVRKVYDLQLGNPPLKLMAALRKVGLSYNTYRSHWEKVLA